MPYSKPLHVMNHASRTFDSFNPEDWREMAIVCLAHAGTELQVLRGMAVALAVEPPDELSDLPGLSYLYNRKGLTKVPERMRKP